MSTHMHELFAIIVKMNRQYVERETGVNSNGKIYRQVRGANLRKIYDLTFTK